MSRLKDMQRNLIVSEASKLFLNKHFSEVTMGEIAKELDIGEATMYRYFGKKENLIVLVGQQLWLGIKEKYFDLDKLSKCKNGLEKVRAFFDVFIDIYLHESIFLNFLSSFDNYVIERKIDKDSLESYDQAILEIEKIFEGFFVEGQKDGSINKGIQAQVYYFTAARSLLCLAEKLSNYNILNSDEQIDGLKQIKMLIDIVVNYLK